MKRKFSPVRSDNKINYEFDGELVKVTHTTFATEEVDGMPVVMVDRETTDIFNFIDFPDGQAVVSEIETTLPINPFISVKKVAGILELELINFIGADATNEEKYPEWEEI